MKKGPIWDKGVRLPKYRSQPGNLETSILVIGGGLAGVLTCYLLSGRHKNLVLIEKDKIAHGATGLTTAFVTADLDTSPKDLISMLGPKEAVEVWRSGEAAVESLEDIIEKEKIDCGWRRVSAHRYARNIDELMK
jgi:glycine/D-amino acid oxidase-like deaminating enzyme